MFKLKRDKKKYVPYCPKCKSLDVHPTLIGMIGGTGFKCMNCGYRGFCPEIEVDKVKELKKIKNKS